MVSVSPPWTIRVSATYCVTRYPRSLRSESITASDAGKLRVINEQASAVINQMPPREATRINTSLDSVHASGPLGRAHCVIHGNSNYKQTGLMQAYGAYSLLQQPPNKVGFASGCQAFGHRELLGAMRSFGLVMEPNLTVHH